MKAAILEDVKKFKISDIKQPIPDNNKVIIEIIKTGICGSDIHNWDAGTPKGLVMGHEFTGRVVNTGSRTDLKIGDRVTALPISPCGHCEACETGNPQYCPETWTNAIGLSLDNPGGLTKEIAVRPDMVIKLPDNITDEEGAMVEPTAVGLHAIHLADIRVGDKVLVVGGGIIGLVSAMFAKLEGAEFVAISETNEARGKKSVKLNVADTWYNAKDENFLKNILTKAPGGFDIVIDCSGNTKAVQSELMTVKPGGTIVLVGVSPKPIEFASVIAVMKELTLKGAIGYTKDEFKNCISLMANKKIDVKKFVDDIVPLTDTQKAYERLISGTDDAVKIMVDPNKYEQNG